MKRLILIALVISVVTGIVFAQVDLPTKAWSNTNNRWEASAWASPQSDATAGRLRSSADNFIRADAYSGIKFDKFYSMFSYKGGATTDGTANLGFATKAGSLYIGAYYGGKFWANVPSISYTESYTTWKDIPQSGVKSITSGLGDIANDGKQPVNTFSLLFGFADMGVRLSLFTNKEMFSDTDFISGTTEYSSYEAEAGGFTPQLVWSMSKGLTDIGIQPYVGLTMDFDRNFKKTSEYNGGTAGTYAAYAAMNEKIDGTTDNKNNIKLNIGLGGVTLVNKDGFKFSADLDYAFDITDYDNEYNYTDANGKNQIYTGFKGRENNGKYIEESITNHKITPSFSGQWSGGPVSFRFKVNLNVPIKSTISTENELAPGYSGSLRKEGTDSTTTNVGFNPDIRLAAQWKIIPKITLNLGGRIDFNSIETTTKDSSTYSNGVQNLHSSTTTVTNKTPGDIRNSLAMGFTLNATDNVTFELTSGASNGTVNVFGAASGTNGLLYFTNLLVSLRY